MNYLDIVNNVLRRLREDQVSSLYQNSQSTVVAALVNDAKRMVENSHDWSALRTDLSVGTSSGVTTYSLTGSGNRATILDVRDTTNNAMLRQVSGNYIRRQELVDSNPGLTRPTYYAFDGVDSSGDSQIKFWPTPDNNYVIKAHVILRTADLEAEGDTVSIPAQPIMLMAHAMAAQERGDVSSTDIQSLFTLANKSIGEHIMLDAGKNPEEMVWYPV